jgi:glycosyltransferase involved in cell wall biosynthesis
MAIGPGAGLRENESVHPVMEPKAVANPTVSVVITTYNVADYLELSVDSVLAQTYQDWELLIIDDASADSTWEIAGRCATRDGRIHLIRNETNQGIARTRNRVLALARGTYIAVLDGDDLWLDPKKLEMQVAAYEGYSASERPLGILGTWIILIDDRGNPRPGRSGRIAFSTTDEEIRRSLLYRNQIAQSSVLFVRQAAVDVGGYDNVRTTMSDHDLWLKIATKYALATLPIYALGYRVHNRSVTHKRYMRVAVEELAVVFGHRREYPGFALGLMKGLARLALAMLRLAFSPVSRIVRSMNSASA